MAARTATGLEGVLPVDKPAGMTSHDVVTAMRRATGERRIGHAGTLDPVATGLLVLLIGPYTRLAPYLSASMKRYRATVRFGVATDTDDAEGDPIETRHVPIDLFDEERARAVVAGLVGVHDQVPPAYSAIKRDGVTAHRAARSGASIPLEPRTIRVFDARLLGVSSEDKTWDVDLSVSAGTYVRAIARDLGRALGTCAHLAALRRIASGTLSIDDAHPLHECVEAASVGEVTCLFADPFAALDLPVVDASASDVFTGRRIAATVGDATLVAVRVHDRLAAIYRLEDRWLVPDAVFPEVGTR